MTEDTKPTPSFSEAARTWAYIGLNSFGGPAGQIAVMHRVLVEEKRWISEERFLHALNYCMLLPGPEAMQLATYVGWLLHGTRGGLVAGTFFVLPGMLVIYLLSVMYAQYQEVALVEALFFGLKSAVLAIVAEAVVRIGKRALKTRFHVGLSALAFVAIFFFNVPFPAIIVAAALIGYGHSRLTSPVEKTIAAGVDVAGSTSMPPVFRSIGVIAVWGVLWFAPLASLRAIRGPDDVFLTIGTFFSGAAVVTFGGAYSVLAYIAQEAVETYGWLRPGEMLDGLAMAETTPGPLIMVVQFVGFLAGFRNPGGLAPLWAATLGAALTTWVTFIPCFLWIFLGAPYIEALRGRKSLNAALGGITAAVVGVILNLSVWFLIHTVFGEVDERTYGPVRLYIPDWATIDLAALVLAVGAGVATFKFHIGMLKVLAACALIGMAYSLVA